MLLGDLDQLPREAVATRPRGQEIGGEVAGESLRLVVARRFLDLTGAGDDAVQAGQEQHPLGDQQDALPKQIGRASCRERVSVRVDLGGRRLIKKKKNIKKRDTNKT